MTTKYRPYLVASLALAWLISAMPVYSYVHKPFDQELLVFIEEKYGNHVQARLQMFETIIVKDQSADIVQNLNDVNNFFNQVQWISDSLHWGKKDYWQTPLETLVSFKGDCEDIAIAKYTALRVMGIPERNLALVYSFIDKQPHMVLAFYPNHDNDPYILDSYIKGLKRGSERFDLTPVYEFNSTSVWMTDTHFIKKNVVHPKHLTLVEDVKERINNNREILKSHNKGQPIVPFQP